MPAAQLIRVRGRRSCAVSRKSAASGATWREHPGGTRRASRLELGRQMAPGTRTRSRTPRRTYQRSDGARNPRCARKRAAWVRVAHLDCGFVQGEEPADLSTYRNAGRGRGLERRQEPADLRAGEETPTREVPLRPTRGPDAEADRAERVSVALPLSLAADRLEEHDGGMEDTAVAAELRRLSAALTPESSATSEIDTTTTDLAGPFGHDAESEEAGDDDE